MNGLPPIFLDLAIILITAGIITVVFKWLKQPLVLGYIVAGFFIGPYFPWFPAITDDANVHVWSDIGIVFLMFAIGLEFSIKKLKKVGGTGFTTAFTELFVMFLIGSSVGKLLGFSHMESIFLGCMLSISSTAIIIKSFDDLKFKQQKFTSTVTAVLVVEDLVAVLLLVVLSTLSVSRSFDGGQLGLSILKLVFFLIIWFTFGIFLIPTLLRWMRKWMTEETLCIVSVGLCFGMVVLASYAGFSSALGAFVMGAILSETIEADVIHRVITPIKNLFAAIFFVSVGMLIKPQVLVQFWFPILAIACTVVLFKPLAASLGVLLSGKSRKTAIQSGICFCQIGEFSFIIAGLGLQYGVINEHLYPIIVSVSIITTFVTPYMIKGGAPVYEKIEGILPERVKSALDHYANLSVSASDKGFVRLFLRKQIIDVLVYGAILAAIFLLSVTLLKPFLLQLARDTQVSSFWAMLLGAVVTLLVMSPFLWALAIKDGGKERIRQMLNTYYEHNQAVVVPMLLLRYACALFAIGATVANYIHLALGFILILAFCVLMVIFFSKRVTGFYNHIESRFKTNFNQRQAQQSFRIPETLEQSFLMERVVMTPYSKYMGLSLMDSGIRDEYNLNVVTIERGEQIIDIPNKDTILMPGDRITVIGSEDQITRFRSSVEVEPEMLIHDRSDHQVYIYRYEVVPGGPLSGTELRRADFQRKYNAMVIAIERGTEYKLNPKAETVFEDGDAVFFVSPNEISLAQFVAVK